MAPPGTIKPRLYGAELQSFMVRFRLGIFKKIRSQSVIEIIKAIWVPIPWVWGWAPIEKILALTGSKKFASGQAHHKIGIGSHMAPITFITLWGLKCFGRIFLAPTGSKKFASGQAPHRIGIGSHMAPITFITLWGLKCFGRNFFGADWFQKKLTQNTSEPKPL